MSLAAESRRSTPPPARKAPSPAGFLRSFVHAWEGLLLACAQRNMKVHVVSGLLVCLVGSAVRLGLAEKVSLIFCVMLVFFAEILNTALEALVDLHVQDFSSLAKQAKDAAAAAVLVLAIGTVVVFAAICVNEWGVISASGPALARQALFGLPLAAVEAALLWARPRPRPVDHALFAAGLVLLAFLWSWTVSLVFTALAGGLLVLAWRASARRAGG